MPGSPSYRTDLIEERVAHWFAGLDADPDVRVPVPVPNDTDRAYAKSLVADLRLAGLLSPEGGDEQRVKRLSKSGVRLPAVDDLLDADEQPPAAGACGPSPDVYGIYATFLVHATSLEDAESAYAEALDAIGRPVLGSGATVMQIDEAGDPIAPKAAGPEQPEVAITQKGSAPTPSLDQEGGEDVGRSG